MSKNIENWKEEKINVTFLWCQDHETVLQTAISYSWHWTKQLKNLFWNIQIQPGVFKIPDHATHCLVYKVMDYGLKRLTLKNSCMDGIRNSTILFSLTSTSNI